ncbi:uncharacterized protein [Miscanthus floridulus]|uniref:uncharacterized protein n=1 Tax=Miscanthus floridulus TaxID=154761 RepID=UPI003457921D
MDGGTGLNILYANMLDRMGTPRESLRHGRAPFYGIIPGVQATPLRSIHLPVTFGDPTNFQKELLDFKVVDFSIPYHALLAWPCYAKFMAIPHYGCLKLKTPGPRGVITMATSTTEAYLDE